MIYAIVLHFDAPFQSWGTDSRFQHRSAGHAPSKSAVCGMVCAACGAAKESNDEKNIISRFVSLNMDCFCLKNDGVTIDYHTVQRYRKVSGSIDCKGAVLTQRAYWQSGKYNVVLSGCDREFLTRIHTALQNPVWGVWLGRKCCIPAAPLIQEPVMEYCDAKELAAQNYYEAYSEVQDFNAGTDTWMYQPVGFGEKCSSGREGRVYAPRRINRFVPVDSGDETEYFNF